MFALVLALSPLVTVSFAPLPLPKALERLSEAAGERLVCAKALSDEVLLARLKDADEERVKREIAATFDAKWEPIADGWLLKPDPAATRRRTAAAAIAREKALKTAMAQTAASLADASKSISKDDDGPTPGERAVARLVATIGLHPLLDMAPNERIVFAEDPTPMQRPFPVGSQSALSALRRASKASISRFRLVVRFVSDEERYTFDLEALDANGALVDSGDESLALQTDRADTPTFDKRPDERPVVVGKNAREYTDLMSTRQRAPRDATFVRWGPILADPVSNEPTGWYPGAALVAAAEARGDNLIGTLGERCYARFGRPAGDLTPSLLYRTYAGMLTKRDDWILVRSEDDAPRVSRIEARALIARALAQNGLDIDSAADWQARHPDPYSILEWLGAHLGALLTGSAATLAGEGIEFWSRLSPSLRHSLRQGAKLPFSALPSNAGRAIFEDVYWNESIEGSPEPEPSDDASYHRMEITERLPRGLPAGTVSLDVTTEPVVAAWVETSGEPVFRGRLTAEAYGNAQARWERSGNDPGYDCFRLGASRTYTLRFDLGRYDLTYSKAMVEITYDPAGVPIDRLPDDFLKRAAQAKRKALETPVEDR